MLFRLLTISLCLASFAWSFSTGAGSCNVNPFLAPHVNARGKLSSHGASVKINGAAPGSNSVFRIKAGTVLPIELSSSKKFKGFLMRISKTNVNTSTFLGKGSSTNVQVLSRCTTLRIGGLSHISKDLKSSVKGTIKVPKATGFTLHVSMVVNTTYAYTSVYTVTGV